MKSKSVNVKYYENADFSEMIKNSKRKKYFGAQTKRVTMNISQNTYQEAHELDKFMSMGYQNVLKTAMILGLRDLHEKHGNRYRWSGWRW